MVGGVGGVDGGVDGIVVERAGFVAARVGGGWDGLGVRE